MRSSWVSPDYIDPVPDTPSVVDDGEGNIRLDFCDLNRNLIGVAAGESRAKVDPVSLLFVSWLLLANRFHLA